MLRVMRKHRDSTKSIDAAHVPLELLKAAKESWDEVVELGSADGLRNSQISVIAPTGTIAFMMDCDTTGIEPDIALVKYKKLVGGGMIKIVNGTVPVALKRLGYDKAEVKDIVEFIDEHDTIEGAPHLRDEHLAVFDCAFKPTKGSRSIHYMGHLKMLGAVQPFISGAISKTINMPEESTPTRSWRPTSRAGRWVSRPSPSTGTAANGVSLFRPVLAKKRRSPLRPSPIAGSYPTSGGP